MKDHTDNLELYIKEATRTDLSPEQYENAGKRLANVARLEHAGHGIVTEVGELMDTLKRHIYYGVPLDVVNLKEEAGDLMWYIAILLDELSQRFGITDVLAANIEKLKQRYPNKFSEEDAVNRDVEKERALLGESPPHEVILEAIRKAGNVEATVTSEQVSAMLISLGRAFKWLSAKPSTTRIEAVAVFSGLESSEFFELVIYDLDDDSTRYSF